MEIIQAIGAIGNLVPLLMLLYSYFNKRSSVKKRRKDLDQLKTKEIMDKLKRKKEFDQLIAVTHDGKLRSIRFPADGETTIYM